MLCLCHGHRQRKGAGQSSECVNDLLRRTYNGYGACANAQFVEGYGWVVVEVDFLWVKGGIGFLTFLAVSTNVAKPIITSQKEVIEWKSTSTSSSS
jgi:hypothetical protein